MNDKALGLLGLARKARYVELGEEPAGASCRSQKARLLLVASDAGEHTVRRARSYCRSGKPVCIQAPFTKSALGGALGVSVCAICAVTDPALALAFVQALGEPERYEAALDELTRQTARVTKRRQEEKAHRNNIKHGKK
ncbi:MAG: L7Ae/L30e/S12e/Gadd45 family ribosomal protein [Oscillospiraceae bacterium]